MFSVISLGFAWLFLWKTLFLYGFRVISLGFFWFFVGKTLFSYGFLVISLGFFGFVGKTLFSYGFRVISVGFQKVGYSSGKSDFPDNTIFLRVLCHFLRFCLVFPRETLFSYVFRVISRVFFWFFVGKHCFPTASVSFPQVFRRKTSITLVIPRENPIFLTFPCFLLPWFLASFLPSCVSFASRIRRE